MSSATVQDKPEVAAEPVQFPEVSAIAGGQPGTLNQLLDVDVVVAAELGRVKMPIANILKLAAGSVVELERSVSEPIDLLVQGTLLAKGEVVVVEDHFAIRIREIVDPRYVAKK